MAHADLVLHIQKCKLAVKVAELINVLCNESYYRMVLVELVRSTKGLRVIKGLVNLLFVGTGKFWEKMEGALSVLILRKDP